MALSRAAGLLKKVVGELERVNPDVDTPGPAREQQNKGEKVSTALFKVIC